jgi:hypothetical protein
VTRYDTARLELGEAGLHGAAGDTELAGDLQQADPRERAQGRDETSVQLIDSHVDQYFTHLLHDAARLDLLRWAHL